MSDAGPFDHAGPRWFTIPAHRPFVEDLARGLTRALGPLGPQALSQAILLTPTRRGARALAEAFLTVSEGRAVLLPQVRALGDLDEGEPPFEPGDIGLDLPPAVSGYRRRFELARLVVKHSRALDRTLDATAALELADALAGFLDSLQIEEVEDPLDRIDGLVTGDMAKHWERSAEFLKLALRDWPRRLKDLGLIDSSARQVRLLRALERQWTDNPPTVPLIAAGSTGTAPATADLLAVVSRAPLGAVVLPGLDLDLADDAWNQVGEQHPQGAMKRLLIRSGATRDDVRRWPAGKVEAGESRGRWRRRLINEALRPAEATADWRDQIARIRQESDDEDPIAEGLKGLTLIAGRGEEDTAGVAALLLREALETPGKTCALVTPDRDLARRVSAKLARWGLAADSSAGAPLSHCPVGVLIGLVARTAIDPCDPVRLLAILKHPLTRLGMTAEALAAGTRTLELQGLRGPRPNDWTALEERLADKGDAGAAEVLGRLRAALEAVVDPAPDAAGQARALAETLEALARGEDGGLGALWAGPSGEGAGQMLSALIGESDGLPEVTAAGFAQVIETLMAGATVRAGGVAHPRLRILGAIEARLIRADRLVLAGLEEGVWPQGAPVDPFLSRPMRQAMDLPPPERRIGLSAHDFAQAACAPEVFLLHSERREGAPAVESRWLWRLKTLARGAGVSLAERPEVLTWARALDRPGGYSPVARAEYAPPLEARPIQLPVTQVEALTRDPYAVYARAVLKLRPLDRPDEPMEQRARGTAIHKAFEDYAAEWPAPGARFAQLYIDELRKAGAPAAALAREAALAKEAGAWIEAMETRRRADGTQVFVERSGQAVFPIGRGLFTVTAKADRIEVSPEGLAHVLDFKTGMPPTDKMVKTGFSPQLTLTAAIIAREGFKDIGPCPAGNLTYVRITGRDPAGEEITPLAAGAESQDAAEQAFAGLRDLIGRYEDEAQPYRSRTAPQFVDMYEGDYWHLARVYEWSTSDGEDDE